MRSSGESSSIGGHSGTMPGQPVMEQFERGVESQSGKFCDAHVKKPAVNKTRPVRALRTKWDRRDDVVRSSRRWPVRDL